MTGAFTVPGRLPGYNELTTGHWAARNSLKRQATETVCWLTKAYGIKPIEGRAAVEIVCYEPNKRRDPSNVRAGAEKIILDALQEAGIIRNDNWRWLDDRPPRVLVDRREPRIEVTVSDAYG